MQTHSLHRRAGQVVAILAFASFGFGQVSVPASITDSSGKSVHGLQKSDFSVAVGKNAGFDSVEEVPALSFTSFSDPVPVFILFDAASIPPPVQGQTAKQLLSYLRKAADERLAVTVLVNSERGLQLVHDMSTDPKVFVAAMDRVMPKSRNQQPETTQTDEFSKAVGQEVQQLQILTKTIPYAVFYKTTLGGPRRPMSEEDEARRSLEKQELESLRQVGQIFQRSRKRKLLLWLTGYFPISVANHELTYGDYALPYGEARPKIRSEMTPLYQGAINSINDARISVYPTFVVDARNYDVQRLAKDTLDGLDELARRTGGKMLGIVDSIDFTSTVAELRKSFDSYYILTFLLQSVHKDSWIDSNIKVTKSEAKVTAPRGFFAEQ
jgi:VWFA-related protein